MLVSEGPNLSFFNRKLLRPLQHWLVLQRWHVKDCLWPPESGGGVVTSDHNYEHATNTYKLP
jgi:hypothetical protein